MILGTGQGTVEANLLATYFELGQAAPGSQIHHEDGYRACMGPFDHSACNFAADLNLTPNAASRLRELALQRSSFQVYHLPTDDPDHAPELLLRAGFRLGYRLCLMQSPGIDSDTFLELREAKTLVERETCAEFMTEQFFEFRPYQMRQNIAYLTSRAERLQLFSFYHQAQKVGGVMLHPHSGVLGIYNLCITSGMRHRGLGGSLVREIQAMAYASNLTCGLQCELRLESWYRGLGFEKVGMVDVFSLAKDSTPAIIKSL